MKRLFLLIAVCMIGMVNALAAGENAPAGFTVVPPEESGTGSYVLTFKKAAADGETLHNWNEVVEEGSLEFLRSATSISIITEGDCELSTADVIHIMGGNSISTDFPLLTTLDMGDAKLELETDLVNMKYAKADYGGNGLTRLTSFVFPKTTTGFHKDMFSKNTTIQEIIMLEGSLSAIPTDAFDGCTSLSNVSIPNGVTSIGENAFKNCSFQSISLPNTLVYIGKNAFDYCGELRSITIPASVEVIGEDAFQHNYSMTDVYVLTNNVTIANQAFDNNETYNFKYNDNGDGIIDYKDWGTENQDASPHPLRLHIPTNDDTAYKNYVNPYLRMLNDDDMEELYDVIGNAYSDPIVKAKADELFEKYNITNTEYNVFKRENWVTMTSADGRIKKFFKNGASGLFNQYNEVQINAYGGWRNFMLVADDIDEKTWPDKRLVDSRWYSAVFPFDLSFNQVESTYGANTDVREFTNVWEHTVDGKLTRTVRFNTKPSIPSAISGGKSEDKNKPGYIVKGRPYMIHPGTRVEVISVGGKEYGRTIAGVNVDEAEAIIADNSDAVLETVERSLVYDEEGNNKGSQKYYFKGTFKKKDMPANTFYLGYNPDPENYYPLAFYVTTTGGANKWSAFTSIVRKTNDSATDNSNAKSMGIDFTLIIPKEEILGITTGIESVSDQKSVNNGVVYNLNGQVIGNQSTSNLSKGIYIVNGKKIVVR